MADLEEIEALIEAPYSAAAGTTDGSNGDIDGKTGQHRERDSQEDRHSSSSRNRYDGHSREHRDKDRDREFYRDYQHRSYRFNPTAKEQKSTPAEDPLVALERERRTIFAYNLSVKVTEQQLQTFIEQISSGEVRVRQVKLIVDKYTGRSKGIGYVELDQVEMVPKALMMKGALLEGQPLQIKASEAEKNLAAQLQTTAVRTSGNPIALQTGPCKLVVCELPPELDESDLQTLFEAVGPVEEVQLARNPETGVSKCFGFIKFKDNDDTRKGLQLDGLEIFPGKEIRVGMSAAVAADMFGELPESEGDGIGLSIESRKKLMIMLQQRGLFGGIPLSATGGILPTIIPPGFSPAFPLQQPPFMAGLPTQQSPNIGFPMPPGMQNLPVPGAPSFPSPMQLVPQTGMPSLPPVVLNALANVPSQNIFLKNMFDPTTETDADFHLEIREDVVDECTRLGLTVVHAFVEKESQGHVYVRFDTIQNAVEAKRVMGGRWFSGRQVVAEFVPDPVYASKFPGAMQQPPHRASTSPAAAAIAQ